MTGCESSEDHLEGQKGSLLCGIHTDYYCHRAKGCGGQSGAKRYETYQTSRKSQAEEDFESLSRYVGENVTGRDAGRGGRGSSGSIQVTLWHLVQCPLEGGCMC